jgi:hypothetical protein
MSVKTRSVPMNEQMRLLSMVIVSNANTHQTIIQSNQCASGATCINSTVNVYLIGNPSRAG